MGSTVCGDNSLAYFVSSPWPSLQRGILLAFPISCCARLRPVYSKYPPKLFLDRFNAKPVIMTHAKNSPPTPLSARVLCWNSGTFSNILLFIHTQHRHCKQAAISQKQQFQAGRKRRISLCFYVNVILGKASELHVQCSELFSFYFGNRRGNWRQTSCKERCGRGVLKSGNSCRSDSHLGFSWALNHLPNSLNFLISSISFGMKVSTLLDKPTRYLNRSESTSSVHFLLLKVTLYESICEMLHCLL